MAYGTGLYTFTGFGEESIYGHPASPSLWVPFATSDINWKRQLVPREPAGTLGVKCMVPGAVEVKGTLATWDFNTVGQLLLWWNGQSTGPISSPPGTGSIVPFFPTPTSNRLKSFTAQRITDNDLTEQFQGCMMDSFTMEASGGNTPVQWVFNFQGQNVVLITNPSTPTLLPLIPMPSWNSIISIGDVQANVISSFGVKGENRLTRLPGSTGTGVTRALMPGTRAVTGHFSAYFEDHTIFKILQSSEYTPISYVMTTLPSANTSHTYSVTMTMPACIFTSAPAVISGPGVIVQNATFAATIDPLAHSDITFTLTQVS